MLYNKISENPRKGFLQLLDWGMSKIKKRICFRTLSHSSFLLPSVMEFFTEDTLMSIAQPLPCQETNTCEPVEPLQADSFA